jgi:Peptidase C13 family
MYFAISIKGKHEMNHLLNKAILPSFICTSVLFFELIIANCAYAVSDIKKTENCKNVHQKMYPSQLTQLLKSLQIGRKNQTTNQYPKNKENTKLAQSKNLNTIPEFLVFAGGGAPRYNEIALEKNVLYFQRTLKQLGYQPSAASAYFANGNDGKATIRYIDNQGNQQFKVPNIPNLLGASTLENLESWFQKAIANKLEKPIFFYFTGHGTTDHKNLNNNSMVLWNEKFVTVQSFSQILDKLPEQNPVTVVMAQCYSGSFANIIYQGGNPKNPIALQTRCGFFATIKSLPSVGCTPSVNEADYKDYSSSFFAGLSGKNRIGKVVASADYDKDNKISYREAHAFAKVDEQSMDLPISTSENWLQEQLSDKDAELLLQKPIIEVVKTARLEQKYVVNSLAKILTWDLNKSSVYNYEKTGKNKNDSIEKKAYAQRLIIELINISTEKKVRDTGNQQQISILDRLLKCEGGSPK